MSLYRSCAYCGASLDPSEICDCQIEFSELEERTSCKTHSLQKKKVVEDDNLKKYIRNQLVRKHPRRVRWTQPDHPEEGPIRRRGILSCKHRNNLRGLRAQNRRPT